ncbi:hypothetical protein N7508_005943 [Penicillium antarcticum]|uniref:uncharacterized protein n=1 Tax=Penicillium antarcticum TaxID=416450 RepID=UPI00238C739D|nr:uncharacterized protein N7508_005943 [Penicillium antarcticum]KAJ5306928.1 hypothetical protein N7508_005943 [Penicillium antarcticum]
MSDPEFKCPTCQQFFSSKNHLRRHESSPTHFGDITRVAPGLEPNPSPGRAGPAADARHAIAAPDNESIAMEAFVAVPVKLMGFLVLINIVTHYCMTRRSATNPNEQNPEKTSLPFLLNYSAPGNRSSRDVNRVLSLFSTAECMDESLDSTLPSLDIEANQASLFLEDSWSLLFGSFQYDGHAPRSSLPLGLEDLNQRQIISARMVECIVRAKAQKGNFEAGPFTGNAQEFFAEHKIGEYIEAYFERIVRPRSRVVLKSTFNLGTVSTPLLLCIFLMGADCDTSYSAKLQAVEYAELTESVVFESADFQRLMYRKAKGGWASLEEIEIELIQAAILILLIQLSSPNGETRRRTRIQRPFCHDEFLKNETCIRMMSSIAMMDCHYIMFFNDPPILSAPELGFDLPAEEKGMDIPDAITWELWARNERKHQRPPPLNLFIQELLLDNWTGSEDQRYKNLNFFALYVVISAFHRIIFGLRTSLCDMSDAKRQIDRALSRWIILWEALEHKSSQDQIYRAGIMIHGQDLCAFAKILLRTPLSETGDIAHDSTAHIHELLKRRPK